MIKIRVLGCSGSKGLYGGKVHRPATYLINGNLALDAGALLDSLDEDERLGIDHILLSHAHLDHVADAIMLPEATFQQRTRPVTIYGPMDLLFLLDDLYENCYAPFHNADKIKIPGENDSPVQFENLRAGFARKIAGFRVTPCRVNHPSIAYGYLLEDRDSALFYSGDTGPTDEMWSLLSAFVLADPHKRLTVFIDIKFPNSLADLALVSGHYTPQLLEVDLKEKFVCPENVRFYATHLSPRYSELEDEIHDIAIPGQPPGSMRLVVQDEVYEL